MRVALASLLLALPISANEYSDAVGKLPAEYTQGGCRQNAPVPFQIKIERDRLRSRYAWAIPSDEAIKAIADFAPRIVEIGAGSGYWAHLLSAAGANVAALDDWSWGRPRHLWFPVAPGGEGALAFSAGRSLLIVWPPRAGEVGQDMAANALRTWRGDRLVYVGEVLRGHATPEFFAALARDFHLVEKIAIPQWWNRSDAVYLLERGDPDGGKWMREELALCGV